MDKQLRSFLRNLNALPNEDLDEISKNIKSIKNTRRLEKKKALVKLRESSFKKLELISLPNGYMACESKTCSLWQECAQHTSAGTYREEGGPSPNLLFIEKEENKFEAWCDHSFSSQCGFVIRRKPYVYGIEDYWNERDVKFYEYKPKELVETRK